jgi:hypothetical protein
MPEAKPDYDIPLSSSFIFPITSSAKSAKSTSSPFIDVSYKSFPNFHYVDSGRKNDFLGDTAKETKSLESVLFLMNQYLLLHQL